MAQFLIAIYEAEAAWQDADPETFERLMGAHKAFGQKHGPVIVGGEGLDFSSTAKTVRQGLVTDGPFLETKEMLGGYYVVEAHDLDAAVEIAKDVPAQYGGVEVRPIMVMT